MDKWTYPSGDNLLENSLHIEVIADYGGEHSTDHAFSEVTNHFFRFDTKNKIRHLTEHPVFAFSTVETGFWIGQEALHSQHNHLVIFSNTAPRGDIKWHGEQRQFFACGILDNGLPIFAVHAGYNLSFIKERLIGLWVVKTPNVGTQFRSRDYYPEATMAILNGDLSRIGEELDIKKIPDYPKMCIGSVDGYGNLKTTIRKGELSDSVLKSPILRVTINRNCYFVLNTLVSGKGKTGDLCMVYGSSGGKNRNFLEFIQMQGRASDVFKIDGPTDNLGEVKIEAIK